MWVVQNTNIHRNVVLLLKTFGKKKMDTQIYIVASKGHVFVPSVYKTITWPHKN
jgi:hypothetical protein